MALVWASGRHRRWVLALLSGSFLAASSPSALLFVLLSAGLNLAACRRLAGEAEEKKGRLLALALAANLAWLVTWKLLLGWDSTLTIPLGISFYTIQQMTILVDVAQGLWEAPSALTYWNWVSFFPQITAGPIARQDDTMEQLGEIAPDWDRLALGVTMLTAGLFKKLVLADSLARFVGGAFGRLPFLSGSDAWLTMLAYALQIFLDFSGYSEIAIGCGLMLGIRLPDNFHHPYRRRTLSAFWKEWHMSLTSIITDYLYTPLARPRRGPIPFWRSMLATIVAMGVCGLWHGLSETFLLWGLFHGLGLAVVQVWTRQPRRLPGLAAWLLTQLFVLHGYVLFRAPTLPRVGMMVTAMYRLPGPGAWTLNLHPPWLVLSLACLWVARGWSSRDRCQAFRPTWGMALASAFYLLVGLAMLNSTQAPPFIYAHF